MIKGYAVNGVPDSQRKACVDCFHMQASVSWWCVSEEAKKIRMTTIPGTSHCPAWEPIPTLQELLEKRTFWEKLFNSKPDPYDWISVDCSKNPVPSAPETNISE